MPGLTLRGFQPGDLDAMHALDVVCFEHPFRFTRSAMRGFATAKKARVLVYENESQIGAFVILHLEQVGLGCIGYIVTLDVAPALRRQGIAALLMQAAEQQALAARCTALVLHVFTGNNAAIRFYEEQGFVRSRRIVNFYGDGLDAWVYNKRLARADAPQLR